MSRSLGSHRDHHLLPVVIGLTDGILTALTLAAGQLVGRSHEMGMSWAMRIATAALASGAFVYYVGNYAQLRRELIRAERELNLTSRGHLATTRLGRAVLLEAVWTAALSSSASFLGALIPLLTAVMLPSFKWASVLASVTFLGILGIALAQVVHGSYWRWCAGLVAGGVILSIVGIGLHIT